MKQHSVNCRNHLVTTKAWKGPFCEKVIKIDFVLRIVAMVRICCSIKKQCVIYTHRDTDIRSSYVYEIYSKQNGTKALYSNIYIYTGILRYSSVPVPGT